MEKRHKERLVDRFPEETRNKKIEILNINDDYGYMDKDLIEIIRLSVTPYLP